MNTWIKVAKYIIMNIEKKEKGNILEKERVLIIQELEKGTDNVREIVLKARLKNLEKKLAKTLENNSRDLI